MSGLDRRFLDQPIAHRGLHGPGAVENSLTAFERAILGGFGIELDVQVSSDGVPMVFHDYVLDRLTETEGVVADHSAAELSQITLRGVTDTIPTLAQVLEAVAGQVPLLVEIKDQDGALGSSIGGLSDAVAQALHGYAGPVAVMSFNPAHVADMDGLSRGLVTCGFSHESWTEVPKERREALAAIKDLDGMDFISHNWKELGNPRIAEVKADGLPILCWTIRSPSDAKEALKVADNITFEGFDPLG